MKVLIVKLSSMGDIIHTLPAISDAAEQVPDIRFDWVVDRAFAEIPLWHQRVERVIPSAHRYWKRNLVTCLRNGEIRRFLAGLRQTHYDLVIDAQSSLKSSLIARLSRASSRAGMDAASVREYGAHFFYQKTCSVAKQQHAITRIRQLFASVLGYSMPATQADFAIEVNRFKPVDEVWSSPYLVFIPNASWESKLYPESHWRQLLALASDKFAVVIPWGSEAEKLRAEKMASGYSRAFVLPRMQLSELGYVINRSQGVITVDTGLGHLAAALGIPAINLYGPTNPDLIGAQGQNQVHLQASLDCVPCYKRQCYYGNKLCQNAVCLDGLLPDKVWRRFCQLVT